MLGSELGPSAEMYDLLPLSLAPSGGASSHWAPLRAHDTSNQWYILALGLGLFRAQDAGNKSYTLALGPLPHFETKTPTLGPHFERNKRTSIKLYILAFLSPLQRKDTHPPAAFEGMRVSQTLTPFRVQGFAPTHCF